MSIDFITGFYIQNSTNEYKRKSLLFLSVAANIGVLGFFKYYNFFLESWKDFWSLFSVEIDIRFWEIALPLGISFYTFHSLSYTIDIYRKKLQATTDYIAFGVFITFFPQLVAGPIARATQLLPQFLNPRSFNSELAKDGIRQMIWGLFKKVVVADTLSMYVDDIFLHQTEMSGSMMWLGSIYFAIQVYADFSGYSDMANGIGKLFGIQLMKNFALPFFSNNMAEFWHKWHISLSTWFRDYVYFPLGGSQKGSIRYLFNLSLIFALSGLWHGPKWNYIWWGLMNVIYIAPITLYNKYKHKKVVSKTKSLKDIPYMLFTFIIFSFSVGIFRAENLINAKQLPIQLLQINSSFITYYFDSIERYAVEGFIVILLLIGFEWSSRKYDHPLIGRFKELKTAIILFLILMLGIFSDYKAFIYFQF